jgi:hypothetical protein
MVDEQVTPKESPEKSDVGSGPVRAERYDLAMAWSATTLLGVASIRLVPDSWGFKAMLIPVALMGLYLWFAVTRTNRSLQRVADSVYFMGFLWTMSALVIVLTTKEQMVASDIYRAFGVALIATTVGMFLRLVLLQFYRTTEDQEQEAADEIHKRIEALSSALIRCQSAAEDSLLKLAKGIDVEGAELVVSLADTRKALRRSSALFDKVADQIDSTTQRSAQALDDSMLVLLSGLDRVSASVERIDVPPKMFVERLEKATAEVTKIVAPLVVSATEAIGTLHKAVDDLGMAMSGLPGNTKWASLLGELRSAAQDATAAFNGLSERARESGEAFKGTVTASSAATDQLKSLTTSLGAAESALGVVKKDTQLVTTALKEVVDFASAHFDASAPGTTA